MTAPSDTHAPARWRRPDRSRWHDVAERLWPLDAQASQAGTGGRWLVAALAVVALLVGAALPLLRLVRASPLDAVWAEDGSIFVTQQARSGFAGSVLQPYAGYAHLVPRTLVALVELAPARYVAAGLAVTSALVTSALALLTYRALAPHVHDPLLRAVVPAYLVLLPIGRETVANVANLHWYLLPTCVLLLFWTPASRTLRTVSAVVLVITALSDPFALLLLPVAALRLWARRTATSWLFGLTLAFGVAVQSTISATAPQRVFSSVVNPVRLALWYLGRVVGGTLFGEQLTASADGSTSMSAVVLGLAGVGLIAFLFTRLRTARARRVRPFVAVCCLGSVGAYLVLVGLSGVATARYAVPSSVLLVVALVATSDAVVPRRDDRGSGWTTSAAVSAAAVGACLLFAVTTSFLADSARPTTTRWEASLTAASQTCPTGGESAVPINPQRWFATLPCSYVTGVAP